MVIDRFRSRITGLRFRSCLRELSVVSCQLSVVSCQLSVVSCQLSVVSCQLSVVSGQWSVVSCQLSVVSCQLSVGTDGEPFSVRVKWNRTGSVGRVFFAAEERRRTRKMAEVMAGGVFHHE